MMQNADRVRFLRYAVMEATGYRNATSVDYRSMNRFQCATDAATLRHARTVARIASKRW